ncbi:MAG: hypothetical protein K6T65_06530 [Peptococcaceae bacterium]|nr:hypothetical protein [Peptococcaceae bacterium]
MNKPIKNRGVPTLYKISILISMVFLLEKIFWYSLCDLLSSFLLMPMEILLHFLFYLNIAWSIYYIFKKKKVDFLTSFPLLFGLLIFLLTHLLSASNIGLKLDFYSKLNEREKIVFMLETGELKDNDTNLLTLPDKYKHLSKGGKILYEKGNNNNIKALFFTLRGVTDNYSGFIYCSDDKEPPKDTFGGNIVLIRKIKANWFFVSFT